MKEPRTRLFRDSLDQSRALRRRSTDAERALWRALRGRRLGGAKFRRQVPLRGYIADFYCDEARLVIELDGGGHGQQLMSEEDASRSKDLARVGVRVLRFWNNEVLGNIDGVLHRISEALVSPSP